MKKNITFEQAMTRLEEIVSGLDMADMPLEKSLEMFGEGAELVAYCKKRLDDAQLKIENLFPDKGQKNQSNDIGAEEQQ